MARFIGWLTACKANSDSTISRVSPTRIEASAGGWNIGGTVRAFKEELPGERGRDIVRLSVDGGRNGALMGYTVAWLTETDGKPVLQIHLPNRRTMDHDFSRITLTDDETDVERVIYQAPAAEEK